MPFIIQGKTNWRFLLIVVILVAIVGGGILFYSNNFKKEVFNIAQQISNTITKNNNGDSSKKPLPDSCSPIQNLAEKDKCIYDEAIENKNDQYCQYIEGEEMKMYCYVDVSKFKHAITNKDSSMCWFFMTPNTTSYCWANFGMANWNSYKNNQYSFELMYYPLAEISTSSTYSNNSIVTYFITGGPLSQLIFLYKKPTSQSLFDWYNNNFPNNKSIIDGPTTTIVNGYNALEVISELPGFYRKSIFLERNGLIVEFFFDLETKVDKIPSDGQKFLDSFIFFD